MQCLFATLCSILARTCKCLYHTWEAFICTPLTLHSIFWGGAASQGEVHSRGSGLRECFETHTWWVPLSTRGRVYDSSSFALGMSDVRLEIPPCDRGSWVCTHMVERCILWGDAFWVMWFSGFWAFACSFAGCVEPLPLSGGTGVCLCMTVLSSASFLRSHA